MSIFRDTQDLILLKARKCSLAYGVYPCTASGAAGSECYNTRKTCQDLANYTEPTQDIYFCESSTRLPDVDGLIFPTLASVSKKENEINPGALSTDTMPLGKSSEMTVSLIDHMHHDRGIDPYYATRTSEPQGTFWARWLKRNFYQGMPLYRYRVVDGVISTTPELFYVQDISTSSGTITIKSYDIIRRLFDVKVPAVSTGTLSTDITDSQTVFNVTGGDYPASGSIAIGRELMTYTRSGNVFTVVRGDDPKSYSQGDVVQRALVYDSQRVDDTIYDLLVDEAGVDSSLITFTDWQSEVGTYLTTVKLSRTIAKPTKLITLLSEISEQTLADIYFDQDTNKIVFSAYKPGNSVKTLTDDTGFTNAGIPIKRDDEARVNVVSVYYGKRDQFESESAENYARVNKAIAEDEVINRYDGEIKERIIYANWLDETQSAQANYLGFLILQEGEEERTTLGFELEYKDSDLNLKDIVTVTHKELVDNSGAPEPRTAIIISKKEVEVGSRWQYKAILSEYAGIRFGQFSPNEFEFDLMDGDGTYDLMTDDIIDTDMTYPPYYDWPFWSDAQKALYVWFSDGTNNFSDGREPWQFV